MLARSQRKRATPRVLSECTNLSLTASAEQLLSKSADRLKAVSDAELSDQIVRQTRVRTAARLNAQRGALHRTDEHLGVFSVSKIARSKYRELGHGHQSRDQVANYVGAATLGMVDLTHEVVH